MSGVRETESCISRRRCAAVETTPLNIQIENGFMPLLCFLTHFERSLTILTIKNLNFFHLYHLEKCLFITNILTSLEKCFFNIKKYVFFWIWFVFFSTFFQKTSEKSWMTKDYQFKIVATLIFRQFRIQINLFKYYCISLSGARALLKIIRNTLWSSKPNHKSFLFADCSSNDCKNSNKFFKKMFWNIRFVPFT